VDRNSAAPFDRSRYRAPPGAGKLAMWIFLASLGMFFASSMLGYGLVRFDGPLRPPRGALRTPTGLWLSTAVLVLSGWTMDRAVRCVRRERQLPFRLYLTATAILGATFIAVQGPCLVRLLEQHEIAELQPAHSRDGGVESTEYIRARDAPGGRQVQLYAFIVVLIALHGLHVLGGLLPIAVASMRAWQGRYDHEVHGGVVYCAMYWHFLDAVWIFMFASFLLLA
jgi:heme/copper-type cytochrome/quinol oxidase subunit 3